MKLNIMERLQLLNILPAEGNYVTLKIVRQLREDLSFSEDEIKLFGVHQEGDQVTWSYSNGGTDDREIQIGEKATDIIVESLKKLDREEKLTEALVGVYEKFVT